MIGSREKNDVKIPMASFPASEFVSDAEKMSEDFGLKIGQAISSEWFYTSGSNGTCRYFTRWAEFNRRRLYAIGKQPVEKYKNQLTTDGDLSYTNLDFTPVKIISKFVDLMVNGTVDREMSVKTFSQDIISAEKKSKFQEEVEADMIARDFLTATQDQFGVDAFNVDPSKLPEDNDELSLFMNLNYKPSIEIAGEISIDTILLENKFSEIRKRVIRDLVEVGVGMCKHEFLMGDGINISYVDPASVIHSPTDEPDYNDCFYWGEVKQVHINELPKIDPRLNENDLKEISKFSSNWVNYWHAVKDYGQFQKDVVMLLYYNYKTTKRFTYKIKKTRTGGDRAIRKDDSFSSVKSNDLFEVVSVLRDVWYEGVMILGTERILKWQMSENMVREKSSMQHSRPNYIAYAPRTYRGYIESHVERMIPFADQIQLTHLKQQQIKSRMVPDGVFIDVDGLNDLDLGTEYGATEALRLYFQTGSVVGRSRDTEGDLNNGRVPIKELNTSSAQSKMAALISDYNHQLNMLRDVTGLNESVDASTPDPKALVGVQKMAAYNSNVATRHILDSMVSIQKELAECVFLRIADVLSIPSMRDDFAMKIGKYNLEIVNDIKDLYLSNLGIFIEVAPDEEEKQQLENNISISLQEKRIELEDATDIRLIKNIKLANEMLKVKRRKRSKEIQRREDDQVQMQALINQDSQKAADEAAIQKVNAEAQAKIAVKQAEGDMLIRVEEATAVLKSQLMDKEFNYQMQLKGVDADIQGNKIKTQEDRKDERIDRQSTQQSVLIDQRQKGLPPQNFESTNDNLDNLDLSSFEP